MQHELKLEQPYFERTWNNEKLFEVRKDDRDFQSGDKIILKEYDAATNTYSGRILYGDINYVLRDTNFLPAGLVVFGFYITDWKDVEDKKVYKAEVNI